MKPSFIPAVLALSLLSASFWSGSVLADAEIMGNGEGIISISGDAQALIDGETAVAGATAYEFDFTTPVSYDIQFDQTETIDSFVLWNDRDVFGHGGTINSGDGVADFTLEFFNGATLLARYDATAADFVGQEVFDFGANAITGVTSVRWTITSVYGPGAADFEQIREIGFNFFGSANDPVGGQIIAGGGVFNPPPVPEPQTYAMLLAGLGLVGWMARRRIQSV